MSKKYRVKCHETDSACRGLVKFNNSVFAVDGLLPGETAHIELVYGKDRKSTTAKLTDIEIPSPDRVKPFCEAFPRCGGCTLQHASYEAQLAMKQAAAKKLLGEFAPVKKIIGMKNPFHYRHKVHASFYRSRRGMELGIYEENTHKVITVPDCAIQNKTANGILRTLRKLADEFRLSAYNEDTGMGLMRHVLIRCGYVTGQVMVVLVLAGTNFPGRSRFIEKLRTAHPEITTIIQNINHQKTSMVLGESETVLYGNGYIEDELCGLRFRISSKSFYQVNPEQTEILYRTAIDFAILTGKETVLDAYCGTGTIGLIAAGKAKNVIGVENNEAAVRDAEVNAKVNGVQNVRFLKGDAAEYMKKAADNKADRPDVVIMDPPRSGASEEFLGALVKANPSRVVYVSCCMETLRRDLKVLCGKGYKVEKVQGVDMFGWSGHVESIVSLSKLNQICE